IKEVGRRLGVRYILEGSVRKAHDRVRVTAQLMEATSAAHLWAESYDRELQDIFAVQDEIKQQVIDALKVKLPAVEVARARRTPAANMTPYDYLLRGSEYFNRYTQEGTVQAQQYAEKAIALDPQYADGYVGLSVTYLRMWQVGWSTDPQTLERAFALVQQALTLDDSLPIAHSILSEVYA